MLKVGKQFSEQVHVGMNTQKPTKLDENDTQHPYILCHFANYALCLLFVCKVGL